MNTQLNDNSWKELAEALRNEIQEYSWLLKLLEDQQSGVLQHDFEVINGLNTSIGDQVDSAVTRRRERESMQSLLQKEVGLDGNTRLRVLLDYFPVSTGGLFEELINEAHDLVKNLQKRVRENQLLLAKNHEVSRQVLQLLMPSESTVTYNGRGSHQFKSGSRGRALNMKV